MSRNKNLFLFAAYNPKNIVDDALVYYVSELSKIGDVIVCMDCDVKKTETNKLKNYAIHIIAHRHGEYDFGSYKYAYQYAYDNDILKDYDYIYLVNDSVFGPMFEIENILTNMEKIKTDAASIVVSKHKTHSFMESWFVQLNKKIFLSSWFNKFISNVAPEKTKAQITIKYEHGLTNIIQNNKCSWSGLYKCHGRFTYNHPKYLFKHGCPFVKKACFIRHNGEHGKQIKYILSHSDKLATQSVMITANHLYGEKYMKWLLTSNPIKIFVRKIIYLYKKIRNGEI